MKKFILMICFIFAAMTFCFANEVSSEQSAESQLEDVVNEARENVPSRKSRNESEYKERKRSNRDVAVRDSRGVTNSHSERKVVSDLAMIIASTPLITFGGWFFGFSGYLFSTKESLNIAAGAPSCIATGLALFTAGMALLLVGAVHLPRNIDASDNAELARRLQKLNKTLENLTIVSGVFSATGLASLGMGVGMMCYGNSIKDTPADVNGLSYGTFGTGVALTTIGTIFTFSFLPIFISSLSVFCANKSKIESLAPEVAITHDDKKSINEGYGVRLGMRISL
ncbi:MAG: hypothetical protein J6W76_02285 [Spirochaetales bacterium]|nr:hypothetical protein [Spirochaetales bacterium]